MLPRIAIPVPTAMDEAYNQRSWGAYAEAVTRSGGTPVAVELGQSEATLRAVVAACDGICLPGSPADVDPKLYGAGREAATAKADSLREACDYLLLEEAEKVRMPVLGVCFGVQSMNVWRGGTLVQDLMPVPVNHEAGGKVAVAHAVVVARASVLGGLLTEEEAPVVGDFLRLPVNTSHHQAVGAPGDGLRVVARSAEDGVIEAVEVDAESGVFHVEHAGDAWFLLGVQWHPERSFEISAASRALFGRLVSEAAAFAARRDGR